MNRIDGIPTPATFVAATPPQSACASPDGDGTPAMQRPQKSWELAAPQSRLPAGQALAGLLSGWRDRRCTRVPEVALPGRIVVTVAVSGATLGAVNGYRSRSGHELLVRRTESYDRDREALVVRLYGSYDDLGDPRALTGVICGATLRLYSPQTGATVGEYTLEFHELVYSADATEPGVSQLCVALDGKALGEAFRAHGEELHVTNYDLLELATETTVTLKNGDIVTFDGRTHQTWQNKRLSNFPLPSALR
jgi:hypothetical protein